MVEVASRIRIAAGDQLTAAQLYAVLSLRIDVFVVEQNHPYPEIDGHDLLPGTEHLWLADIDQRPMSYVRVLEEPGSTPHVRRVGRVVTHPDMRGQKLAETVMRHVLVRHGHRPTVLDAQSHLAHWYARFGYEAVGPQYVDSGVAHVRMVRPGDGQR